MEEQMTTPAVNADIQQPCPAPALTPATNAEVQRPCSSPALEELTTPAVTAEIQRPLPTPALMRPATNAETQLLRTAPVVEQLITPAVNAGTQRSLPAPVLTRSAPVVEQLTLRLQIVDGTGTERRVDARIERGATVGQLKERYLRAEIAGGWQPRCFCMGRSLGDTEPLAQLQSGLVLQFYLQHVPNSGEASNSGPDPIVTAWARLSGIGQAFPPEKWQDVVFHSAFVLGLAWAWNAYLVDPVTFDLFGRFALPFFSLAWVMVFFSDFLRRPGPPRTREPAPEVAAQTSQAQDSNRPAAVS